MAVRVSIPRRDEPIKIERRGKYLVATHAGITTVFRISWEHDHGERHQNLIFHACPEIPRELEHLVYGPAKG